MCENACEPYVFLHPEQTPSIVTSDFFGLFARNLHLSRMYIHAFVYGGESRCLKTAMSFFMYPDESAPTRNWASCKRTVSSGCGAVGAALDGAPIGRCSCLLNAAWCDIACCLFFARLASASSAISTTIGTTDSIAALGSPCRWVLGGKKKRVLFVSVSTDEKRGMLARELL